ncbi:hypothetical protein I4U23_029922 [Adineta vaga]|nr:hypothetical protein I4U23_029922 [Adineta vaga]
MVFPYDYSELPLIAIVEIFSYLSHNTLLSASSTCSSWRNVLYHPKLWSSIPYRPLRLHLIHRHNDIHCFRYLTTNFLNLTRYIEIRFDPTDLNIIKDILQVLDAIACTNRQIKILIFRPTSTRCALAENEQPFVPLCDKIFHLLKQIIECNQALEILSFGCWFESLFRIEELVHVLAQRQSQSIKQLHLASIKNSETHSIADIYLTSQSFLPFISLNTLSMDSTYLTNELLQCFAQQPTQLKRLIVHVSEFRSDTQPVDETVWQSVSTMMPDLRVTVHMLNAHETFRKYSRILRPSMPLSHLRMYFCSSLNVDLLCYLSVHYRSTLECLDVIDSVTEPALRYHNLFRAEPDPLVLLAWQCKKLTSLTILGYEVLEVNLLAIAKLRPQLRTLNVCADCVMTLQYGHLQMNHQFVEDDDGNDAFIQYGICTNSIQTIIGQVLGWPWHPLSKHEIPIGVYEYTVPLELSFIEQIHNVFESSI